MKKSIYKSFNNGIDFKYKILFETDCKKEALKKEYTYTLKYKKDKNFVCCNDNLGIRRSEEYKLNMTGENNSFYNKKHSKETIKKYSENRKGVKNSNAKPKKYYENNPVLRCNFKKTCKRLSWCFNNFKEIYKGDKLGTHKKFYYVENADIREMV